MVQRGDAVLVCGVPRFFRRDGKFFVKTDGPDGKLAFGTIDSFLLWRLTGGKVHATDATNACSASPALW